MLSLLALLLRLWSHPAIGIVAGPEGSLYYSDAVHVWRVLPNGEKSIAVPNVHTHRLAIDAQGNLFGEHLSANPWTHYLWRLTPSGTLTRILAPRPGFLDDYDDLSLARDAPGRQYFTAQSAGEFRISRRNQSITETLAVLPARDYGWMSVLSDGTVFLAEQGRMWEIRPNTSPRAISLSSSRDRYALMAAFADTQGNVFFAGFADRKTLKRNRAGEISVIDHSPAPWRPVSGWVAADGHIWLLEANDANEQRVRRLRP